MESNKLNIPYVSLEEFKQKYEQDLKTGFFNLEKDFEKELKENEILMHFKKTGKMSDEEIKYLRSLNYSNTIECLGCNRTQYIKDKTKSLKDVTCQACGCTGHFFKIPAHYEQTFTNTRSYEGLCLDDFNGGILLLR